MLQPDNISSEEISCCHNCLSLTSVESICDSREEVLGNFKSMLHIFLLLLSLFCFCFISNNTAKNCQKGSFLQLEGKI